MSWLLCWSFENVSSNALALQRPLDGTRIAAPQNGGAVGLNFGDLGMANVRSGSRVARALAEFGVIVVGVTVKLLRGRPARPSGITPSGGRFPNPFGACMALQGETFNQRRVEMASKLFVKNEHKVERTVRVLLGLGLLSLLFVGPQTMWGLIGIVPLATGLLGTCPLYTLLGFSTCPRDGGC